MARFRPHKMYPGALLAQEVCSYEASTQLLAGMHGDLSVIVHSDRDCSNVLPKTSGVIHAERDYKFFCTNMREDEMVTGQGNAKLRRSIELVWEAYKPQLIVVLSTCPTVMIGDNIKNVARKAARDLGANVVSEVTHGLRPKSPAEVVDDVYSMLCRGAKAPNASVASVDSGASVASGASPEGASGDRDRRVNLVGIGMTREERREIKDTLAAMGLTLNVVLSDESHLDDFLRVGNARWNIHPGPHMLLHFDEQCKEKLGMDAIEVPLPFGVRATSRFYQAIAAATGVVTDANRGTADDVALSATAAPRAEAQAALDAFSSRLTARVQSERGRPPRCVHNVGSVSTIDLRRIALEEMGEVPLLEEAGFEVKLFIQGPADDNNQKRTAGVLAEMGVTTPFVIFPDPGSLARHIKPGDFDVFVGANFLIDQLSRVNLPLVNKRDLGMGYGRVAANLRRLEEAVFTRFYEHFTPNTTAPMHLPVIAPSRDSTRGPHGGSRV